MGLLLFPHIHNWVHPNVWTGERDVMLLKSATKASVKAGCGPLAPSK